MTIDIPCKDCAHKTVCMYTENLHKFKESATGSHTSHPYFQKGKGRKVTPEQRRFALESLPHWATIGCRFFWSVPEPATD